MSVEAYERAFALDPMQPDVLRSLGFLYRDLGDTERARALLARYVEVAPEAVDRKLIERWIAESAEGR